MTSKEHNKKDEESLKEPLLKETQNQTQDYDIDDDLENFIIKVQPEKSQDPNHSIINDKLSHINERDQFVKTNNHRKWTIKNSLNILSLILLLITCLVPLIHYGIVEQNTLLFYNFFKTKSIHLQINFEIFLAIWIIIIIIIFFSLLRHIFKFTSDVNEIYVMTKIISTRLSHFYYIANFLSAANLLYLYINKDFSQSYGIFAAMSIFSSIFYFVVYREIKKEKFYIKYFLNYITFNVGISFILAWASYLLGTSVCIFLETIDVITKGNSEKIGFMIQGIICLISIVIIVYYKDPFYVIFLVLYQVGLAIVSDEDKASYQDELNIVFTIFTVICLIFGVFLMKNDKEEIERENVMENYNNERKQSDRL